MTESEIFLSDEEIEQLVNEATDEDFEIDDEQLDEKVLTYQQRLKRGRIMRRLEPRLQRMRKVRADRMADQRKLTQRSRHAAVTLLKKRAAGKQGLKYDSLPTSAKIAIDKRIQKSLPMVGKIATRLMPKVRKAEMARLKRRHMNREEYDVMDTVWDAINESILEPNVTVQEEKIVAALLEKAEESGIDFAIISEIFMRGIDAAEDGDDLLNEGFGRVNSFIAGGLAFELDEDLAQELDELSTDTMRSYLKKANASGHAAHAKGDMKTFNKRKEGISRSVRLARARILKKITKEEVEDLDELSQRTLRNYNQKSQDYLDKLHQKFPNEKNVKTFERKTHNRLQGQIHANKRLGEEAEDIQELSKAVVGRYRAKASDQYAKMASRVAAGSDRVDPQKLQNRADGIKKASKKLREDVLNELSKKTLQSYSDKAKKSLYPIKRSHESGYYDNPYSDQVKNAARKWKNREQGIDRARKKLKEEGGAGETGTPEVTNKYAQVTPGQSPGIKLAVDYVAKPDIADSAGKITFDKLRKLRKQGDKK